MDEPSKQSGYQYILAGNAIANGHYSIIRQKLQSLPVYIRKRVHVNEGISKYLNMALLIWIDIAGRALSSNSVLR